MSPTIQEASFVVRLRREVGGESPDTSTERHGEIEHIDAGEYSSFETLGEAVEFLLRAAQDSGTVRVTPDGQ